MLQNLIQKYFIATHIAPPGQSQYKTFVKTLIPGRLELTLNLYEHLHKQPPIESENCGMPHRKVHICVACHVSGIIDERVAKVQNIF